MKCNQAEATNLETNLALPHTMRRMLTVVAVAFLLLGSAWFGQNEDAVNQWLEQRQIVVSSEDPPLLGIQTQESWLVVVVDFEAHPSTNGWGIEEAERLLEQAAVPYIRQMTANETILDIVVYPDVIRASESLAAYGSDGSGKDTNEDGVFLPVQLAEEAVLATDTNWSRYDLDADGFVDRFLILHTTKGQEENPATQSRIWSHFTHFDEPIEVDGGLQIAHYTMASLQTGSSGVGTILHEMLHQMGAADLYPVHESGTTVASKGPGDWDIMASGNWNGGGRWPAMPSGPTLDLIGSQRIQTLELDWPATSSRPCYGPTVEIAGTTEGGTVYKVPIGDTENIFIEARTDFGYDERLPGHGILVSYQDLSAGNIKENELNTNPYRPWMYVVEADGNRDLMQGSNQGEQGDLFGHNTTFGRQGIQIRTHDGLLVPWMANVSMDNASFNINFVAEDCSPQTSLDLPDHGATVLVGEAIPLSISPSTTTCTPLLQSSDGREVVIEQADSTEAAIHVLGTATPNSVVHLTGTITCDGDVFDLDYQLRIMNRVPIESRFSSMIHPVEEGTLEVPLSTIGSGSQRFNVVLDGPLERIAQGPSDVIVSSNTTEVELSINPAGLLQENMMVYGTVVLSTAEGEAWAIDVSLQATSASSSAFAQLTQPNLILATMLALMALSLAGGLLRQRTMAPSIDEKPTSSLDVPAHSPLEVDRHDPWGRPIDEDQPVR